MTADNPPYRRIATEEAFAPREVLDAFSAVLKDGTGDLGFGSLWDYYLNNPSDQPRTLRERIQDLGDQRLSDMEDLGVHHQILGLTPGLDALDVSLGRDLAQLTNERIAEATRRFPQQFSGLGAVALQDVDFSVSELRRCVTELGLKGLIFNSHVQGEYLDQARFDPIFAVAEELDVPIYMHPNTPSDDFIKPLMAGGLEGAIHGFAVETGTHLLRLIVSGVFDRYPRLKFVVGHLGEAIPFTLFRIDHFHGVQQRSGRYPNRPTLEMKPSEYFRRNIWLTTSGMAWEPSILFTMDVLGADRVMYATDYPYQFSREEVALHDDLPISLESKKQLFETNALEVFGLSLD
jgi:5-carboxyvanillate decarboxylase